MSEAERHLRGAHYTPEAAILEHVLRPSLLEPWRARLREAETFAQLASLRRALGGLRILDPACGSGSFLLAAYRALLRLDLEVLAKMRDQGWAGGAPAITVGQLFGIDNDPRAVELTKSALLAEEPAVGALGANLRCEDALFCDWPAAELVVGNPPFMSKNKMQRELGADYARRLRRRFPGVPGHADYCVYWLRRAHDELGAGGRAGFVATNTIRENSSRQGGLDHILESGGTLIEAVSTMVWPGDAAVHVSVVNWIKGEAHGERRLSWQAGDSRDSPWSAVMVERIPASLSASLDVTRARPLRANVVSGACSQGQTHGHEGFVLAFDEARAMVAASSDNAEVVFPYLIGEELLAEPSGRPLRWVIDFHPRGEREARRYALPFQRVEQRVLPARRVAAALERERNVALEQRGEPRNRHHQGFLRRFWIHSYPRAELIARLGELPRYAACCQVTKRPIFEVISSAIRPNAALIVFPLADDYSFGILQSDVHWAWFRARCSTMKGDFRYTSSTVFDSFPWPQTPSAGGVAAVASAAVALRRLRRGLGEAGAAGLRALYASMDARLRDAHAGLDAAVRAAYGMGEGAEPLAFLLDLNRACAAREAAGEPIVGPGVPPGMPAARLSSSDAVQPPSLTSY